MIKLFRKIRQSILSDLPAHADSVRAGGKTGKYLKYAVGEIILVVIGILIALQINNWNTYHLDRISERDYLNRISNDLSVDTVNLSWTINALKSKQESLGAFLELIEKEQLTSADSNTVLGYILTGTFLSIAHPGIANGTFEELKNTGAMKHVTSTVLRTAINNYYFKREHQNDRIEKKRTESNYSRIINSNIPGLERKGSEFTYRNDLVSYKDILDMINGPEFKKIAISEYNNTVFMLRIQEGGLDDSKTLLNLIIEELKE